MKFFKFEMNTVLFLGAIVLTIALWIGFEFYHLQSNVGIEQSLKNQANTPIESSFDTITLEEIYKNRSKFYEETTPTPTGN